MFVFLNVKIIFIITITEFLTMGVYYPMSMTEVVCLSLQ